MLWHCCSAVLNAIFFIHFKTKKTITLLVSTYCYLHPDNTTFQLTEHQLQEIHEFVKNFQNFRNT